MVGTVCAGSTTSEVLDRLSGELVVVLDLDGRVVSLHGSQRPELSWLRAVATVRPWHEVIHPDDAPAVAAGLEVLLAGGELGPIGFRVRLPDGQQRWVEGRAAGDLGNERVVVVLRDVTAEQRRFEVEDRLATLGRVGTYEIDLSDGSTRWSPELRRIFGLGPEDEPLDIPTTLERFGPSHRRALADAVQQLQEKGEPFEVELVLRPLHGPDRWVRSSGEALQRDGQAVMILGTVQDLTDSHQERLRLARVEQLARLTDNGLLELDEGHVVRFMNPRARELLGVPDGTDVEGRRLLAILPSEVDAAPLHRLLETGDAGLTRDRVRVEADRWLQLALRRAERSRDDDVDEPVTALDAHPSEPTLLVALSDITALVQAEQARDAFLATASHELRSPLVAISGAMQTLERGIAGPLPDAAVLLLQVAARSAGRLERLVEDLLDSQRILAGRLPLDLDDHDLGTLVDEVLGELEHLAVRSDRSLERQGMTAVLPVRVDAGRIQQVLSNLVGNALRYAPADSCVEVELSTAGPTHRIVVRDRGPGVPEAFGDRIFERFTQADPSDPRSVGGTGLGLAISRELVERMDGRIGFDSEPGRTEFWVELPAADAAPGGHEDVGGP